MVHISREQPLQLFHQHYHYMTACSSHLVDKMQILEYVVGI